MYCIYTPINTCFSLAFLDFDVLNESFLLQVDSLKEKIAQLESHNSEDTDGTLLQDLTIIWFVFVKKFLCEF